MPRGWSGAAWTSTRGCWVPSTAPLLVCASSLAVSLLGLGECAEAAVLLRTTLAAKTRTAGADDEGTLHTEGQLASVLNSLGEHAEAEALGRATLAKWRRILGRDDRRTLATSGNLALSLSRQGKHVEAVEIEREVLIQTTRLLGAEHEETLLSANNLAVSLWRCGKKTEAEQFLRDTLALALRVLGPNHAQTQGGLRLLCALRAGFGYFVRSVSRHDDESQGDGLRALGGGVTSRALQMQRASLPAE